MRKIDGTPKSVRELFTGVKYTIHYYQREYQWQTKQIEELLADLTDAFLEYHSPDDERNKVLDYGHYFMGSIVLTADENAIIDGQQRLTSLTLLLIYLYHHLADSEENSEVLQMIYSRKAGTKTFNIHVPELPEREAVMNALLQDVYFDPTDKSETVRNIYHRYQDITELMTDLIDPASLPYFKDWLIDSVDFIRIVAQTEQDAHTIFVSMNDRGLSLTPAEMLKGYLLSKIQNDRIRERANDLWKRRILELKELGKEEESDFIKNWIRSQYADTIRERKKNALLGDFDVIGHGFHKWIREHTEQIGLKRGTDYENFVLNQFDKFSRLYLQIRAYSAHMTPGYEYVFYNATRKFTLQYQLILATIDPMETKEVSDTKIRLMSCFVDLYFTRRIFHYKTVDYNAMLYNLFLLSKKVRRKPLTELLPMLQDEINGMEFQITNFRYFGLNLWSIRYMRHLLGRLTEYTEVQSGLPSHFPLYVSSDIKNPYDIEHVIANHYERHADEYSSEEEFQSYRNNIGSLILLPRDKNRSFSDLPSEVKIPRYAGENLLARSLCEAGYINNPQFLRFIEGSALPFQPCTQFTSSVVREREALYRLLAERIWGVEVLEQQIAT